MSEIVHIALAANHVYMPGLRATFTSLINASANKDAVQFHILSDGLLEPDVEELKAIARRLGLGLPIDFRYPDMNIIARHFKAYKDSYTTFLRLFFADFFPELDWIIWSDSDVLWFRDPREFWNGRDAAVALQWGREPPAGRARAKSYFETWHVGFDESKYCCAGILLMNLKRLRTIKLREKSVSFVEKWGTPPFCDQDILNEICYNDAKIVDDRWGCYNPDPNWRKGVVLHCSGVSGFFKTLEYDGKWPMWAQWFRYYRQVVEGERGATVCSLPVRLLFAVFGLIYVPQWLLGILTWPLSVERADVVRCALYYAWLMRKKLW